MIIGIKDEKVIDKTDRWENIGYPNDESVKYIEKDISDVVFGDSWDSEKEINLKDAPKRFIEPEPTEVELLQQKVNELESRLAALEK